MIFGPQCMVGSTYTKVVDDQSLRLTSGAAQTSGKKKFRRTGKLAFDSFVDENLSVSRAGKKIQADPCSVDARQPDLSDTTT